MGNVLFILTDQWPRRHFGFAGADIPTPNMDRLAAIGADRLPPAGTILATGAQGP